MAEFSNPWYFVFPLPPPRIAMPWKLKDDIPQNPTSVTDLIEGDLEEVTELELFDKGLERLPDDLGRLRNLRLLRVWHNDLQALPDSIGELQFLETLDVDGNRNLDFLPSDLRQLDELKTLYFHSTAIDHLPVGLEGLAIQNLALPRWLPDLPPWPVKTLILWDMPDTDVAQALRHFPAVTRLSLNRTGLSALLETQTPRDLQGLRVFSHPLSSLPDLRSFRHLTGLHLWYCDVTTLPAWVGGWSQLKTLDLSDNKIATLPRPLADLGDDLDLTLDGNPLTPPLDELAKQGTPALFAYLRSLPDDPESDPVPDPDSAAEAAPQPQMAPLAARVENDRLVPMPPPAPQEADQAELQAMHAETLDWARQTLERTGNHPLLGRMVQRCVTLLGDRVQALQVLALAFANDRLRQVLEDYANDGADPLSAEQRGMCNGLVGNIKMLLNWTQEWKDYKRKTQDSHISAEAAGQVRAMLSALAQDFEPYRQVVDPVLPPAIADLAEAARPGQSPEMVQGAADGLNNLLAPVARQGLLKLTEKDKEEIRKTVMQTGTKAVLYGGASLAMVAAAFLLGHAVDVLALAHALPLEYGWLRQVIAALRGLIFG